MNDPSASATRHCAGVMLSGDVVVTLANCAYDKLGNLAILHQSRVIVKRDETELGAGIERNWDDV